MTTASIRNPRALVLAALLALAGSAYFNLQADREYANAARYHPVRPTPAVIAANPLNGMHKLAGIPTFLLYDDGDPMVPPAWNAVPAQRELGSKCRAIVFHGNNHSDRRIYDPERLNELLAPIPRDVPVILLHGYLVHGSEWFAQPGESPQAAARDTQTNCGEGLRRYRPCRTSEFGGDTWGNDRGVRALEELTQGDKRVVLVGPSMGAALMFRFAEKHPEKVAAMVGLSPVCNLEAMCHTGFGAEIVRAYGGPG